MGKRCGMVGSRAVLARLFDIRRADQQRKQRMNPAVTIEAYGHIDGAMLPEFRRRR
jgi:hypothetical protein